MIHIHMHDIALSEMLLKNIYIKTHTSNIHTHNSHIHNCQHMHPEKKIDSGNMILHNCVFKVCDFSGEFSVEMAFG